MSFQSKYGEWALITGGTSGIGEAMANLVASKGINVVLVARRQNLLDEKARALESKYGIAVRTISADLTNNEALAKVFNETRSLEIGLLIPNAAIETQGSFTDIPLDKELAAIQMNVISVCSMTHHYGRMMAARGRGGILLVASMIGHMPSPYMANYAGVKAYVVNWGFSIHYELRKRGVDVTVVSPGPTDTPMLRASSEKMDIAKMPPVQQPDDVAKLAIEGLGKTPHVVPGRKNAFMLRMVKLMSASRQINSGGKMMDQVMKT